MTMIDTREKRLTQIVGEDASAARLAAGPKAKVHPTKVRKLVRTARVAAAAGKPATAAALTVVASGAVSPASMKKAQAVAKAAENGHPKAAAAIAKLRAARAGGNPKAQRALDAIALAAKVNQEVAEGLTDDAADIAEEQAFVQALENYDYREDPIALQTVEAAKRERAMLRHMIEQLDQTAGIAGPGYEFRQGQDQIRDRKRPGGASDFQQGQQQIRNRPRKPWRFTQYRGRTAIVGQGLPPGHHREDYFLP